MMMRRLVNGDVRDDVRGEPARNPRWLRVAQERLRGGWDFRWRQMTSWVRQRLSNAKKNADVWLLNTHYRVDSSWPSQSLQYAMKPDIGSESRLLLTHVHSTPHPR